MQVRRSLTLSRIASCAAICATLFAAAHSVADAQTAPAADSIQLTPYTTPYKSVSAGVPSGWKAEGSQTTINLTGPQDESIILGHAYIAPNGTFQAGQKGPTVPTSPCRTTLP
jgi:hypothetical protein